MKYRYLFLLIVFYISAINSKSQNNGNFIFNNKIEDGFQIFNYVSADSNWVELKKELWLEPNSIFKNYKYDFGLSKDDEMFLLRIDKDNIGFEHYRYQQIYKGIPVEGGEFIIHSQNGISVSGNGNLFKKINISIIPIVSENIALQKALNKINTQKHEVVSNNNLSNNLIIKSKNGVYLLSYLFNLIKENNCYSVYVNALNGDIIDSYLLYDGATGTTITLYNGTQSIQTMWTGSATWNRYVLKDNTRGYFIHTVKENWADYHDYNNNWINNETERAAATGHWAMEKSYDYYKYIFNRNGADNAGVGVRLLVYVPASQTSMPTGYIPGSAPVHINLAKSDNKWHVSLDIVGHEFTHAVNYHTWRPTGNDDTEQQALNEGFADIFGSMIEYWTEKQFDPGKTPDWTIGEDLGTAFRSMSDPSSIHSPDGTGASAYDDTYWNQYSDRHYRCGVLDHWFYLLANGDSYNGIITSGITREKAAKIVYRTITTYLTSSSNYADAKNGSIQSAIDLYGQCSPEVYQTILAWDAVNVKSSIIFGYDINVDCGALNNNHIAGMPFNVVAGHNIESNCSISNNKSTIFKAGNSVRLTNGFKSGTGANTYFHAYLEACSPIVRENIYVNNDNNNNNYDIENIPLNSSNNDYILKCFPNPFNSTTTIQYALPKANYVKIIVYNSMNLKVAELVNTTQTEGTHQIIFNGTNLSGGIYYCILETDNFRKVEKIVLVK